MFDRSRAEIKISLSSVDVARSMGQRVQKSGAKLGCSQAGLQVTFT
jgi:hypothetical protein